MDSSSAALSTQSFFLREIWILEILIGVLLFMLADYGLKQGIKFFRRKLHFISYDWKERLDHIVYLPLHVLLWVIAVAFVIDVIALRFNFSTALEFIIPLRTVALILCISWLLLRWKKEIQHAFIAKNHQNRKGIDPGLVHALGRLSSIIVFVIAALIILQVIGLNIMPLIAFGGIGAAAIGFAAKDVIANFFGGLMLYFNRPFMTGDYILLSEKNCEGHVEEIGWYLTALRDKDKRTVYLPNSIFSHQLVINSSRMSHRRMKDKISVSYDDSSKLKILVSEIRSLLEKHPFLDHNLPILVYFEGFRDYSLDILIDAYSLITREDDFFRMKQDILLNIQEIISVHQANMPFPTMVVCTNTLKN